LKIPHPHPALVVFALWLLVFAASSQTMIIAPILPLIGDSLQIGEALLGTLVSAYSAMVGLFAVIAGPFSDRVGRRRILLLGSGLMTFALAFHGLVVDYASFIAVRVVAGIAGGVLSGAAVSYVGDFFPYDKRGWATGWIMSGAAAGQIFGIPMGVVLAGALGFKTPFYLYAAAMGATFLLVLFRLPQPDIERSPQRVTLRGAIGSYAGMLRRPEIAAASAAFFLMFLGLSLYVVYLPTWLERETGATPNQIATLFLVGGVANVLVGPQAGRISDRVGRKGIILISCIGLSAVMALTTVLVTGLGIAYPYFFAIMALVAMRIGPFSALLTALVRDAQRGILLSLTIALGQVGFAVGGTASGLLYAGGGYAATTLLAAASVLGMGLMVWFLVPEPTRGAGRLGGQEPSPPEGPLGIASGTGPPAE
jgi:predicted MFS family arabinose efflux permease